MSELTLRDGMTLAFREQGEGPALLLLHGFTGSSAAWGKLPDALSQRFHVLVPDLLGHGASSACEDPSRHALEFCVDDLVELMDARAIERAIWVGYSMGGRVALGAAALQSDRVAALVLESASPGLEDADERAARVRADEALAARLENQPFEAFVDFWMALPLFATQERLGTAHLAAERSRRLQGAPRSLAACLRGLGTGTQPSFWKSLSDLHVPTLLLSGEQDSKFRQIATRMDATLPRSRHVVLPDCGHTTHLENPEAWLDALRAFASQVD